MAKRTIGRPVTLEYYDANETLLSSFTLTCRDASIESILRRLDDKDVELFTLVNKATELEASIKETNTQIEISKTPTLTKKLKSLKAKEDEIKAKFDELGGFTSASELSEKFFDVIVIGGEKEEAKQFINEFDDYNNALEMIREDLSGN